MASRNTRIDAGRNLKRRKTRKGTRSCWQCKRRKVKCTYASPAEDVCIGCARRCLDCVGQEFPDQDPGPSSKGRMVGDRIGRLESMIQHLAEQVGGHAASSSSPSVPASISLPVALSTMQSKHQTLSQKLLAAYPSPSDLSIIGRTGGTLALYLVLTFVTPSHLLERRVVLESERLWGAQQGRQQHTAETHPILIARQMLLLACILQDLHFVGSASSRSRTSYRLLGELSLPPRALARRLAEAGMTLVTAHDRFTSNTLEGLECLWLETMYHEHSGSLCQSWLTCRRAISAAHLLEFSGRRHTSMAPPNSTLRQPDGEAEDLQQIWIRLVHSELALCLALGMPPSASCPDDTFLSAMESSPTEDNATHTSKLERSHAAVAWNLIDRIERDPNFEDWAAALRIRTELEEAKTAMPSGWWLIPSLPDPAEYEVEDDQHLSGAMMKLRAQIFHSYLLLLSHLPYMLQAIGGAPTTTTPDGPSYHEDHNRERNHLLASSRNICADASRHLLRRFIHLRSCERTAGYFRLLGHYAWQAAATLLLSSLLEGRQTMMTKTMTSLGGPDYQQHLSDRAMASEAIERIRLEEEDEEEDGGDKDVYFNYSSGAAAKSGTGDALRRLLALEAGRDAVVVTYHKPSAAFSGSGSGVPVDEDQDTILLPFPFAGLVSITPQAHHGSAMTEGCSLLSSNMGFFSIVHEDKEGHQGFDGRLDDEFEDDDDDDDANLTRAVNLRCGGNWPTALYLSLLRPVI